MPMFDEQDAAERGAFYKLFAVPFLKEPTSDIVIQFGDMFDIAFEDTPNDVHGDYTHLFTGPQSHLPPYESFYNYPMGDVPRLWGKASEEVQTFYRAAGLIIDDETYMVPDHLSAELLFMSYLAENEHEKEEEKFLEEHVLKWVPAYCDEIRKAAATTFYKEVANLLKEFILSHYNALRGD